MQSWKPLRQCAGERLPIREPDANIPRDKAFVRDDSRTVDVSAKQIKEKSKMQSRRPLRRFPQHAIIIAPRAAPVIKPLVYCAGRLFVIYSCQSQRAPVDTSEETGAGEANGKDGRCVVVRPRMRRPPLRSGRSAPGAFARPETIGRRGHIESLPGRDAAKAPAAKRKGGV